MSGIVAWMSANKIIATGTAVFAYIYRWFVLNEDKIKAIVLRIEKDAEGGWSPEEKERLALDLFNQFIYPSLPAVVRWIPKSWVDAYVLKVIHNLCEHSHNLKDRVEEVKK